MDEVVKECPFCKGHIVDIRDIKFWTGMSYQILSYELTHHCNLNGTRGFIRIKGKTKEDVITAWENRCEIRSYKSIE